MDAPAHACPLLLKFFLLTNCHDLGQFSSTEHLATLIETLATILI